MKPSPQDTARELVAAGISVLPVRCDGSKQPCCTWKTWTERLPSQAELNHWFQGEVGIGIINGRISGNKETLDIDAPELVEAFEASVDEIAPGLLARLPTIATPRGDGGGRHYHYRIEGTVAGNTKLAQSEPRPQFNDDGTPEIDPATGMQRLAPNTLIEMRGEGGCAISPGSPPKCHPSGCEYRQVSGPPLTEPPVITAEEHQILWRAAHSFNVYVAESETPREPASNPSEGLSPGDDFNRRANWEDILVPAGWQIVRRVGSLTHWRRPGKARGTSATTGCRSSQAGTELFCVFSTNAHPFEGPASGRVCSSHSKFGAYAVLHHGGDFSAAAKALAGNGWGEKRPVQVGNASLTPKSTPKTPDSGRVFAPIIINLSSVQPQPVRWLWPDRIALGKLSMLCGEPGLGKSFLSLDLAARVTTGIPWPDLPGTANEPGSVVLLSAEDDLADTIRPRLDKAGADVSRIAALQGVEMQLDDATPAKRRCFNLEHDLPALEEAIQSVPNTRLVVIDPISSYLGGTDSHKNAEIRGLLSPLGELAARHGVAVVAVTHLNKNSGSQAIHRVTGSLAFIAAARAGWLVTPDKDDASRRLLLPVKYNLAEDVGGLAFSIVDGAVVWEPDPVTISADEALNPDQRRSGGTQRDDAAQWLAELLAEGRIRQKDVMKAAKDNGVSCPIVRRAKDKLRIVSKKHGNGKDAYWDWHLPAQRCAEDVEGAQSQEVNTFRIFDQSEHLPAPADSESVEVW